MNDWMLLLCFCSWPWGSLVWRYCQSGALYKGSSDGLNCLLIEFSCACEVKEKGEKNGVRHMLLQGENIPFVLSRAEREQKLICTMLRDNIKCLPVSWTKNDNTFVLNPLQSNWSYVAQSRHHQQPDSTITVSYHGVSISLKKKIRLPGNFSFWQMQMCKYTWILIWGGAKACALY